MKPDEKKGIGVSDANGKPVAAKKTYQRPGLRVYGKLHHLTQKTGGNTDGKAARKA